MVRFPSTARPNFFRKWETNKQTNKQTISVYKLPLSSSILRFWSDIASFLGFRHGDTIAFFVFLMKMVKPQLVRNCALDCNGGETSSRDWGWLSNQASNLSHSFFLPDRATERLIDWPTDRATERLSEQSTDQPTERLSDRATDRPADQPTNRPTDQSDRATDQPTNDRTTERPSDRATDRDRPTDRPINWPSDRRARRAKGPKHFMGLAQHTFSVTTAKLFFDP